MKGVCEHDSESSGFVESGELLDRLDESRLLKDVCAVWSWGNLYGFFSHVTS